MNWEKGEQGQNVEIDSGGSSGPHFGGGRMGLGGLMILVLLGWIFFKNPLALLEHSGGQPGADAPSGQPDRRRHFAARGPQHRGAGVIYPWHLRLACKVVQDGPAKRRYPTMQNTFRRSL